MYNNYVHQGFRTLTEKERESAEKAIMWLKTKRLKAHHIAFLTENNLDREAKMLEITIEKGRLAFYRRINYAKSDFEAYITGVLPCLKVKKWLFPNLAYRGRTPTGGFHIRVESIEKFLKNHDKRLLHNRKRYSIIEVSATNKSNFTRQIMVGRRIALRA